MKSTPGSLDQALDALEHDHTFLLRGDVFTEELIETFIDYKRKNHPPGVGRPIPIVDTSKEVNLLTELL